MSQRYIMRNVSRHAAVNCTLLAAPDAKAGKKQKEEAARRRPPISLLL